MDTASQELQPATVRSYREMRGVQQALHDETAAVVVFGGLFLAAIATAFGAIRRREVARHREWMIRAFAVAIAISVVRVISVIADLLLTPGGVPPQTVFLISIWSGWILTLGIAELWIMRTRPVYGTTLDDRFFISASTSSI